MSRKHVSYERVELGKTHQALQMDLRQDQFALFVSYEKAWKVSRYYWSDSRLSTPKASPYLATPMELLKNGFPMSPRRKIT